MSKAFTSEETPDTGPVLRRGPELAPGEVRYVTPEGFERMQRELARVRQERADAEVLGETERASRAADLDARAALLESTLAALTVLGPEAGPEGQAAFATWVTVADEDDRRTTWRLVGPDEADPRRRLLSVHAPVARALLGHVAGDVVEVERPGGAVELTVVDVSRTPPEGDGSAPRND